MNSLRLFWFVVVSVFYPLRLILYWLHSVFVFLTKPGAKYILPTVLLGGGIALRTVLETTLDGPMAAVAAPVAGLVGAGTAFTYRVEILFVILFAGMYFTLLIIGRFLAPIMGAFPAPAKPLPPMRPLLDKEHSVATVRAKPAIKRTKRGRYNGDLDILTRRLPKDLQALLSPPGRRAPIEGRVVEIGRERR